jgi:hypothetical protein
MVAPMVYPSGELPVKPQYRYFAPPGAVLDRKAGQKYREALGEIQSTRRWSTGRVWYDDAHRVIGQRASSRAHHSVAPTAAVMSGSRRLGKVRRVCIDNLSRRLLKTTAVATGILSPGRLAAIVIGRIIVGYDN